MECSDVQQTVIQETPGLDLKRQLMRIGENCSGCSDTNSRVEDY